MVSTKASAALRTEEDADSTKTTTTRKKNARRGLQKPASQPWLQLLRKQKSATKSQLRKNSQPKQTLLLLIQNRKRRPHEKLLLLLPYEIVTNNIVRWKKLHKPQKRNLLRFSDFVSKLQEYNLLITSNILNILSIPSILSAVLSSKRRRRRRRTL